MITRSSRSRLAYGDLSKPAYIRAVAFFTLVVGFLVAAGSILSYSWPMSWLLLIVTFAIAIACIFVFQGSSNPVVSGLGVSAMSFAMGVMIGPLVATYTGIVVMQALVTTAIIMVVMSVAGILFPQVFEGFGPFLMAGLVLLIVAQFAQIIFIMLGFEQAVDMPLLAWIGVGIFTLFVAYDWAKALDLPYTLDNAIDASGGLILDAINLFIRLLEIYARAKSDD